MMRAGLVERIPDPDGGLARKFLVTEAGAKKLDAERAFHITGLQMVLEDWSAKDVAAWRSCSSASTPTSRSATAALAAP